VTACTCPNFCRACHCRRIAREREATPGYRTRHQQGLNRWADVRAGLTISDDERPMIPELRQMGHANTAMLFTVYSRWIDSADGGREAAKMAALHRPLSSPNCPNPVTGD